MPSLLLWNDAYFFGGIAQFLLIVTLILTGAAVLASWLSSNESEFLEKSVDAEPPANARKEAGCTVFLLFATGFVFLLFLLARLLA